MSKIIDPISKPILPLRDIVVFPHMIVPLFVGREKSVIALEEVMHENKQILLLTQTDAEIEVPKKNDMFSIGTIGNVLQLLKLPDGTVKVLVEGIKRAKVDEIDDTKDFLSAKISDVNEIGGNDKESISLGKATIQQFDHYIKLNKKIASEVLVSLNQIENPSKIADTISSHLSIKINEKQSLLEILDVKKRLEKIYGIMEGEIGVLQVERELETELNAKWKKLKESTI